MGSQKNTRWDQRRRGLVEVLVRQREKAEESDLNLKDERRTMYV